MGGVKEYHVWDGLLQPQLFPEFDSRKQQEGTENLSDLSREFQKNPRSYARYFYELVQESEITGDITPSYCGLSKNDFRLVRRMLRRGGFRPKVVFLMRDPAQRCWSASRMFARNEAMRGGQEWSHEQLVAHFSQVFSSDHYQVRTKYQQTLNSLDRAFRPNEVYLGFYEDMFELSQVERLALFLGVPINPDESKRIRNSSPSVDLPMDMYKECHAFYRDTYEYCWDRFPKTRVLWPSI